MRTRKKFTKEFKEGAVRLVIEEGRSCRSVGESLGICRKNLQRWVTSARAEGTDAFRGNGNRTAAEEEIAQLRRRVRELEEERAILKKASAYFAKHLA